VAVGHGGKKQDVVAADGARDRKRGGWHRARL
jgi:hypothetical protein